MDLIEIETAIAKARSLRSEFYTDPKYFEFSRSKIFERSWHFLGHVSETEALLPVTLLPDFLDEPVLLVNRKGNISCLSNVCTHRAKLLVEAPCKADLIRCSYHGRRFSLDGTMISMPEFETVENFPSEEDNLKRLDCAVRSGFVFASISPVCGFDKYIDDSASELRDIDTGSLRFAGKREYQVNAHWALYCENYLEGFHIPYVHRSLNEIVDYGTYRTDLFKYSSLQTGYDSDGQIAARYLFIFPNLMFNIYPWGISVNVVRPLAPDRSIIEFLTYIRDDSQIGKGAGADLHSVEMEDEAVVESVQKGVRSRFYSFGRYSPTREQGTHHFHRLIAEFMNASQIAQ